LYVGGTDADLVLLGDAVCFGADAKTLAIPSGDEEKSARVSVSGSSDKDEVILLFEDCDL
jgi:hypothetical protein